MAVAQLQPREYIRSIPPSDQVRYSSQEGLAYTKWLATHHYENFHVVSFLLPRELHQDFYNVYAYCRWADDLGDEIGDPVESLKLLSWWRSELREMYQGRPVHPVFVALQQTVEKFSIPIEPFDLLIQAFEQDQTITRYPSMADVLDYCVRSANPVGHLVLYLCGYRDKERQRLSDYTCTALQLANHWQDVIVDLDKDRVYLPLDLLKKHAYTVAELKALVFDDRFAAIMRESVDVAQHLFEQGLPLIEKVNRRLAMDLELFSRGGMKILDKIREQDYNVLAKRPYIGKAERFTILARCLPRLLPF